MGMGNQDSIPDSIEKGRNSGCIRIKVNRACIGSNLPEKLIQCFRFFIKLNSRIEFRAHSQAKNPEPKLIVRSRRNGSRYRAPSSSSPSWLVDKIDGIFLPEKDILETFPAVRCGFPGFGKLPEAMPKYQWKLPCICGDLVKYISMVSMEGLSRRALVTGTESPMSDRIKSTGGSNDLPPYCKASLILNDYGVFLAEHRERYPKCQYYIYDFGFRHYSFLVNNSAFS